MNSPLGLKLVSSSNSRFADSRTSSPSSTSPLGIVQAPASLFNQYGPPGCARRTSRRPARTRYIRRPALRFFLATLGYLELWLLRVLLTRGRPRLGRATAA